MRLGLPLQLDLDLEVIAGAARELAKAAHPDAGGDAQQFAEVRKAGDLLKAPVSRLKVALELAGGDAAERGSVPSELMDFFSPVAGVLEEVGAFVSERAQAMSGLGKAVLDAKVPVLKGKLELLIESLGGIETDQVGRFQGFDDRGWESCIDEMGEAFRALLFVGKWLAQLREATGKIFEALLAG